MGNKHSFVRQQSSQIQLMASPGLGGRGKRRPKCEEEKKTHHKDQRQFVFITLLEKKIHNCDICWIILAHLSILVVRNNVLVVWLAGEGREEEEEEDGATTQGASV